MKDTEAIALLKKYKAGTATEEERAMLESWYLTWNDEDQSFEEEELIALRKEMWAVMPKATPKTTRLWPRVAVAAAAVAAITLGVWLYYASYINGSRTEFGTGPQLAINNDIAPGKNTATLTLPNGKTINLSDQKTGVVIDASQITYNDNTVISGTNPSSRTEGRDPSSVGKDLSHTFEMTSVATPRGGTYQVTLPDGTRVWLNADSKISFPSQFDEKQRKILLEGEAYFEVAKLTRSSSAQRAMPSSAQRAMPSSRQNAMPSSRQSAATRDLTPFLVQSAGQTVEVLGTHFNINSYSDEVATTTTLIEGSVKVNAFNSATSRSSAILKPNQQSIANSDGMQVLNTDASAALDWKNGEFVFNNEAIMSILRRVSRWYNVEIVYQIDTNRPLTFTGTVSRFDKVSSVLKMLEKTSDVRFEIKGRKIIVN